MLSSPTSSAPDWQNKLTVPRPAQRWVAVVAERKMEMLNGKATIHSVSSAATTALSSNCFTSSTIAGPSALNSSPHHPYHQEVDNPKSRGLKHYQLKAQKVLSDILGKTVEIVSSTNLSLYEDSANNGGGIQLFKHSPCGIVFNHIDEAQRSDKKPRILPGEQIDEKCQRRLKGNSSLLLLMAKIY